MNTPRYEIGIDANEPSEIIITDYVQNIIVARSSKMALRFVEELVQLANRPADSQRNITLTTPGASPSPR